MSKTPKKDDAAKAGDDYFEKVKNYFCLANPIHLFASDEKITESEEIALGKNKKKYEKLTDAERAAAKCTYEATHDPATQQTRPVMSRVAAQLPLRAITLGGMMAYYQTPTQVAFWQVLHQALTSYQDSKKNDPLTSDCEIGLAFSASTAGAVATALSLHKFMKCSSPMAKRFIPLAAVTVGNVINMGMTKRRALKEGVAVFKDKGPVVGKSKVAGSRAFTEAIIGRTLQLAPALILTPLVLNNLEQKNKFCKMPQLEAAYAIGVASLLLYLISPFIWASYSEKTSIPTAILEENIQKAAKNEKFLYYYNK